MTITLYVLSKYQEVFDQFLRSYEKFREGDLETFNLLVTESGVQAPSDWTVVHCPIKPFVQTQAQNFSRQYFKGDVVYFCDDTQFTQPKTIKTLRDVAYMDPSVGVVSPLIDGHVANGQQYYQTCGMDTYTITPALCHIVCYWKAAAIVPWDDGLIGHAWDDIDHCMSMGEKGWKCAVANGVLVKHGFEDTRGSVTWSKNAPNIENPMSYNESYFKDKWRGRLDFLGDFEVVSPFMNVLKQLQKGLA